MSFQEFYCDASGANGASNMNAGDKTTSPTTTTNGAYTQGGGAGGGTTDRYVASGGTPFSGVAAGDYVSIYADGATTPAFIGRVSTKNSSTSIDVDSAKSSGTRPTTAASGVSATVGGPWLGPNNAVSHPFGFLKAASTDGSGNFPRANFKTGTNYAITAAMTHSLTGPTVFQGYTASAGDGGKATIDGGTSGTSYALLTVTGALYVLRDLIFQNNGASGSATGLVLSGSRGLTERVVVNSVRGFGLNVLAIGTLVECEAYGCNQSNTATTGGFGVSAGGSNLIRCLAHDNSGSANNGFVVPLAATLVGCIGDTNGAADFLLTAPSTMVCLIGCTGYLATTAGVLASGNGSLFYVDSCDLTQNGAFGFSVTGVGGYVRLVNNGYYLNTGGPTNGTVDATGDVTFGSQPMTDPANGDFSPAAGAGLARGAGRGSYTQNAGSYSKTTVGYPDIGAGQHADATVVFPQVINRYLYEE